MSVDADAKRACRLCWRWMSRATWLAPCTMRKGRYRSRSRSRSRAAWTAIRRLGPTCDLQVRPTLWGAWWAAGGLVGASGVDDQVAQDLAGGGVDDGDVQVVGERDDVASGVGSADADVPQLPATRRVTLPTLSRRARSWVSVLRSLLGPALGSVVYWSRASHDARQRAVRSVRSVLVVELDDPAQQGLQLGEGGGLIRLGEQPLLQRRVVTRHGDDGQRKRSAREGDSVLSNTVKRAAPWRRPACRARHVYFASRPSHSRSRPVSASVRAAGPSSAVAARAAA